MPGGPAGKNGVRQGIACPPGGKVRIVSKQEAHIFKAPLRLPELVTKTETHSHHRSHFQALKRFLLFANLRIKSNSAGLEYSQRQSDQSTRSGKYGSSLCLDCDFAGGPSDVDDLSVEPHL